MHQLQHIGYAAGIVQINYTYAGELAANINTRRQSCSPLLFEHEELPRDRNCEVVGAYLSLSQECLTEILLSD
jgi:hypothetical protein